MDLSLTAAKSRSESHDEIVHIEHPRMHGNRDADSAMIQGALQALWDGEIDSAWENQDQQGRDVLDIWGYDVDAPDGQMDWRLRITIV